MGAIITGTKFAPAAAALIVASSLLLAACGGGGGGSSPAPAVPPTITPASPQASATPNLQAYTCPTSETDVTSTGTGPALQQTRRTPNRIAQNPVTPAYTHLAISYSPSSLSTTQQQQIAAGRERAAGATYLRSFAYSDQTMRIVSVPTAQVAKTEAAFRGVAGVTTVGVTGQPRYHMGTAAVITNDPYFAGVAPANVPPYYESASSPGQWDMHAIGLDHAFGYSQAGTGYTADPLALGSSTIKLAIIDTGEDALHPELSSKIVQQRCFITNAAGTAQSTGNFTVDEDGHGTDVTGIAGAATNNAFGFASAGGNVSILAYRVFPTPDNSCSSPTSTDAQCSSNTDDIADAINDAVSSGANVISMSLGGLNTNNTSGCDASGNDVDPVEGKAVENAIAHNVIVVAAAGNDSNGVALLDAPACDTGVIAVGATSLDDGQATGTSSYTTLRTAGASPSNPVEYVAGYSQFGAANTLRSSSAWGIVAPGGDPSSSEASASATSVDYLHWIENIWTTTPYGGQSNTNFAGNCQGDFDTGPVADCRTLIAGTSMSTPHVAGAAALILAVDKADYGNPAAMKQLLCSTADNLGDTHQGCGRLNVYNAMAMALHDQSPPTPVP